MKKKLLTLLTAGLLAVMACVPVMAETETDKDSAGNIAVSGDSVSLPSSEFFSGFAAGQTVDFGGAKANGSLFAAGQQVNGSGAEINESLYVAGNGVSLNNVEVYGNIFAAGNDVSITGDTKSNAVYVAGNKVIYEGETYALYAGGSTVILKGYVEGDAVISADTVEITDDAVVTGTLKVISPSKPEVPDDAQINDLEFEQVSDDADEGASLGLGALIISKILKTLYWIVAMAAFGMILCWLFNDHLTRASEYIKNRTAAVVISGILGWLCIPVLVIALLCSYIFAPIGGILGLSYVLLVCVGLSFAGASLSRLVFPKMNVFLSTLIGIAILEAVRMIPFIGFMVGAAADMYLIGYVIQRLWLNRLKKN